MSVGEASEASSTYTFAITPEGRPDVYTLTWSSLSAVVEMRQTVVFRDLLRRLPFVLIGERDPSGQFSAFELMHAIGTRLWHLLLPDTLLPDEHDALVHFLRVDTHPLLLSLPPALTALPWELLCDPEVADDTGFLARRRPLLRLTPGNMSLPPLAAPLKVLLLISAPPGLDARQHIDVESERAAVESATQFFRQDGLLHLYIEDRVTLRRVQQALMRFKPDIVHYIGHGGYEEDTGGMLLWEDDSGQPLSVPDTRIAELLRPRNLRAVLLHGCETAITGTDADVDSANSAIRGVAQTLLNAGIPAVLAQQASFTYTSSQRASEAFYTALTSGLGLGDATFEVRQALAQAERPDWAVPTLQSTFAGLAPLLGEAAMPGVPDPALQRSGAALDLPAPTGVFVGRQRELRQLRTLLESGAGAGPIMAFITGPGGVGKSTLASQAVTRYAGRYKATLTLSCLGYQDFDLFLQRIAEFLKRYGSPALLEQILPDAKLSTATKIEIAIDALNASGPYLLLIDNLESTQQADRTISDANLLIFLQKLLTNLRGGRVLVTGRYSVKDMQPDGKFAANMLAIDLDDLSRYEIYQLLERHPALARLSRTTKDELVREFGGLPYVYDLLSSKAAKMNLDALISDVQGRITSERQQRTAQEWDEVRQRVVEFAALDAIVARLSDGERTLLAKLSVFRRPFPLVAVEQGLGVSGGEWQALIDWGLLRFDEVKGEYQLHSLTKRYAERLLGDNERVEVQVRVAEWYEEYARRTSHDLTDYLIAYDLLRDAGEVRRVGKLVMALTSVLYRLGLYDLLYELCNAVLQDNQDDFVAEAQYTLGNIARAQGNYGEARRLYEESLKGFDQLGDEEGRAMTLHGLGSIAREQGNYGEARRLYEENLKGFDRLGGEQGRAMTLHELGIIAREQGNYGEARRLYEESLKGFNRLGDEKGRAMTSHELGIIARAQGNYGEARRLYEESLKGFDRLRDKSGQATVLLSLGTIMSEQGDYGKARGLYEKSLHINEELGDKSGRAAVLHSLGSIANRQEDYEEASRLYEESLRIEEELGDKNKQGATLHELGIIANKQGDHDKARGLYEKSLRIEEELGDESGRAATLHGLGNIAYLQKNYQEAQRLYEESLKIFDRLKHEIGQASTFSQLGLIARDRGDIKGALDYIIRALKIFERLHSPNRNLILQTITEIRSEVGESMFETLWREVACGLPIPLLPAISSNKLRQSLSALIHAQTREKTQHLVETNRELLSTEADDLLAELARTLPDAGARRLVEQYRQLLARCRKMGIEAAFAEL